RVDAGSVEALAQLDLGLLVVPPELRAVAAARRVAGAVGMVLRDLRVVTAPPLGAGALDAEEVARLLGLPLVGELPLDKRVLIGSHVRTGSGSGPGSGSGSGVATGSGSGSVPASRASAGPGAGGPLGRFCAAFWERMPVGPEERGDA
ncbi:hypothetical protein G3I40_36135, partial [Streptomyces sp. SID14478]|nr:hypothetical protein [Streptomyces sp. SID14478]